MWPWNKWDRFANIEEIWLDYGTDDEGESNILYLSSWVKILQRSRSKDHPWVKKVLNSMPKFHPLIVFPAPHAEVLLACATGSISPTR